jgi:RNA polymerase sigma-70 factor (TIGR02960 family)
VFGLRDQGGAQVVDQGDRRGVRRAGGRVDRGDRGAAVGCGLGGGDGGDPGSAGRGGEQVTPQNPALAQLPEPTGMGAVSWLEPYPDMLFEQVADIEPGPEARYESSEAISLAFITALQLLPPRQRAALVLRDVLGFRASEAAQILESTNESVSSALKRARATLARNTPADGARREAPPVPGSPQERELVRRLTEAYAAGDVEGIISLMTDDVWMTMPPAPFEYQGRQVAARALALLFGQGIRYRLVATRANGQPAFGIYVRDPNSAVLHANGLIVLALEGGRICSLTRFDNSNLARFGLPRTLDA